MYSYSEDQVPLLGSSGVGEVIVRPRDKLREEIKAAKRRRKEEKRRLKESRGVRDEPLDPRKLSAKLEKLSRKKTHAVTAGEGKTTEFVVPAVTFEGPKASSSDTTSQKPTKYEVFTVVTHKPAIITHIVSPKEGKEVQHPPFTTFTQHRIVV